ncbi:MAG: hypothetical protein H6835_08355 [Planctomycetes bacterium]|nr:hypothetical protein [Planctomycetota bacterium]
MRPIALLPLIAALLADVATATDTDPQHFSPAAAENVVVDPYVGDGALALDAAGYVGRGPFEFGCNHTSLDIAELLPDEHIVWLETAHFRIGCALPAVAVAGSRQWQEHLRGELTVLAGKLSGVDPRTRKLDRFLRAHLCAQRLEVLYGDVLQLLGRDADEFPSPPGHDPRRPETFLGLGRHLGMSAKFTVLLLARASDLQRYTAAHQGWATADPTTFLDTRVGTIRFVAAGDTAHGIGGDEEVLATLLTYHVAQSLYAGYRSFGHMLPAWLPRGLALHHARQVSTRVPVTPMRDEAEREFYRQWQKQLGILRKDWSFTPLADLFQTIDEKRLDEQRSLESWALVEWLTAERPAELRAFVHAMKAPFHDRLRFPTNEELLARQQLALEQSFGTDAAGLELAWRQHTGPKTKVRRRR